MNPLEDAANGQVSPLGHLPLYEELPEDLKLIGQDYVLERLLGRGGMGEVWRARQLSANRAIALKLFHHGVDLARFQQEVSALGKLECPGIVRLYQAGHHEGRPFLAMELVEGGTLAEVFGRSVTPRQAAQWIFEAATALGQAHARNIIHRDIKPTNLLLDRDGKVRVTDFGLSKDVLASLELTKTGDQLGTPGFMAPEQFEAKFGEVSPATDVFGLGATLYCLLTGKQPFPGESAAQQMRGVLENEPIWDFPSNPISRDLRIICQKALEKDPARRYLNAHQLAEDLGNYLDGRPISARPPTFWDQGWRRARKPQVFVPTLLLSAVVLTWFLSPSFKSRSLLGELVADWPLAQPTEHFVQRMQQRGNASLVAYSPDGQYLAVAGTSNYARMATTAPYKTIYNNIGPTENFTRLKWHPNSQFLFLGTASGRWSFWRVHPFRLLFFQGAFQDAVTALDFDQEGKRLAVGASNGEFQIWHWVRDKPRNYFQATAPGSLLDLYFISTNKVVLAVSRTGPLTVWDPAKADPVALSVVGEVVSCSARSVDGGFLAVACASTNPPISWQLHLFDISEGLLHRYNIPLEGMARRVTFSPDGGRLAVALSSGRVHLAAVKDGNRISHIGNSTDAIVDIAFSPDGLRLVTVNSSGTARLWDALSGEAISTPWRSSKGIVRAAFNQTDGFLATGNWDFGATVWDLSCPIPVGRDRPGLVRELSELNSTKALKLATWMEPTDSKASMRLSDLISRSSTGSWMNAQAEFLRERSDVTHSSSTGKPSPGH